VQELPAHAKVEFFGTQICLLCVLLQDLDIIDTPQYVFDAEVLETEEFANHSFRLEEYPERVNPNADNTYLPSFLHQDRFAWMGDGVLNDLYVQYVNPILDVVQDVNCVSWFSQVRHRARRWC